jgi:hypothetical protein
MKTQRRFPAFMFSFSMLLAVAFLFVSGGRSLSAQDATPPMADMGNCVTALGIGQEGDACINVLHLSPDAPAVDVLLNGNVALSNVSFGEFSGWVNVPAGEHQVQVVPTGEAAEAAVIDAMVTVEAGAAYHIAATGLVADIQPAIFQVDLSGLDDDTARVRVIHASPDAPAVDVAITGGDVIVPNLEFPNASDALEVPAGSYDLEVRPTGTTDVALELPGVELEAGMVYDVFAVGLAGDGTLNVLVVPSTTIAPEATPAS